MSEQNTVKHSLGDSKGIFAVQYEDKGQKVKKQYTGIDINVPVTDEALEAAFASYTFKVGDVTLKGMRAAAAAKFLHAAESVRGDVRKGLEAGLEMPEHKVREMFNNYKGPSGQRGGFKQVTVDPAKIAELVSDPIALAEYLRSVGAKVA